MGTFFGKHDEVQYADNCESDLRASLNGKGVPEDIKARMLALHEENVTLKESYKTAQDKLQKAKQFIKAQDKLFKEEQASKGVSLGSVRLLSIYRYMHIDDS